MEKPVSFKNLKVGRTYRFKVAGKEIIGILEGHNTRLNPYSRRPYSEFSNIKKPSSHYLMPNERQTFYELPSENMNEQNMAKKNTLSLTQAMKTLKRGLEERKLDPQGGRRMTRKKLRRRTYRKRR